MEWKKICIAVGVAVLVTGAVAGLAYLIYWLLTKGDGSLGGPYDKQAVATDTEECSDIGNDVLKEHGSAVDAAIAAMFCLGVINMHSSGVGGGGTMLVYNRTLKTAKVFDFRETASVTATQNMFQPNADGREKSQYGGLSIAVPGEVHGQYQAWNKYGKLPWKRLVQPAIDLARDGFKISAALDEALNDKMVATIKKDDGLRELLFDKNGKPHKKGDKIKNEKYAKTLEKIQDDPESFYNGLLAKDIARDIRRAKGIVSESDLSAYQTVEREPLEGELSDMKMYVTPPPSSGAVLGLILNILKGYDMTPSDRDDDKSSVLTYHRIIEAFKFSFAWRSRLGDPLFFSSINKDAQKMLQQQLGDRLRGKITDDQTHNVSYYAQTYSKADYGTTHLAVLAPNGDAVSVTTTINHRFGSKYRSNVTGIIYNNEMADFDIPGLGDVYGLYPSPFNYPGSRKRPFSSASPAILTNSSGDVQLVIGASGGKRITTAVSLVLMNKLWFDKCLSKSVNEPRVHTQLVEIDYEQGGKLVPDNNVTIEKKKDYRLKSKIVDGLKALGHPVEEGGDADFAVVQAIYREPKKGIYAKSDPRKYGKPAGE